METLGAAAARLLARLEEHAEQRKNDLEMPAKPLDQAGNKDEAEPVRVQLRLVASVAPTTASHRIPISTFCGENECGR